MRYSVGGQKTLHGARPYTVKDVMNPQTELSKRSSRPNLFGPDRDCIQVRSFRMLDFRASPSNMGISFDSLFLPENRSRIPRVLAVLNSPLIETTINRGRDTTYAVPPAQIRTGAH